MVQFPCHLAPPQNPRQTGDAGLRDIRSGRLGPAIGRSSMHCNRPGEKRSWKDREGSQNGTILALADSTAKPSESPGMKAQNAPGARVDPVIGSNTNIVFYAMTISSAHLRGLRRHVARAASQRLGRDPHREHGRRHSLRPAWRSSRLAGLAGLGLYRRPR
jgi:hypothetical protein